MPSIMSDPSSSIDEINVPEISGPSAEFVYNYYTNDERVQPSPLVERPLDKIPRYVVLRWTHPRLSKFELEQNDIEKSDNSGVFSIESNASKIISEDSSLNVRYFSHTFSNIRDIEQGATDLENYSRISGSPAESMSKMSREQINKISSNSSDDPYLNLKTENLLDSYSKLSNFPKDSLGLKVINKNGQKITDQEDLLSSISKSVSLRMKLYGSILPDIFENIKEKNEYNNLTSFQSKYENVVNTDIESSDFVTLDPVKSESSNVKFKYLTQPVKITGYAIDRYKSTVDGFQKESTFYIEDPSVSSYVDRTALYGVTYIYAIRVIASVQMFLYPNVESVNDQVAQLSTLYVSSKPISIPVECFEYVPPPEPDDIKFTFNYENMKLKIHWSMPSNPQKDIKQFQVFRRKSIKEPFELIAQYGFDLSDPGLDGQKYVTNEKIDANNFSNVAPEDRYLIKTSNYPIFTHLDEDFTVDTEFFMSSDYIYAICSVDAHGMISNYSSQHRVFFDSYKNRLVTNVVCASGSPKQYPNMNLNIDTFKDALKVEGKELKKIQIYFSPEYLRVKDSINSKKQYKIVEAKTSVDKNPYYLLQLINLDNQKLETLKINILDVQDLTLT